MLIPLALPPGVSRIGTEFLSQGRFYASDKARWFQGVLQPIGGWRKRFTAQAALTGVCRAVMPWRENGGTRWIGLGTVSQLYVMSDSGTVSNITPLRDTESLGADPLATDGSEVLVVTDTAHGASVGHYIIISGATAVGDFSTGEINTLHVITAVIDVDSYEIEPGGTGGAPASGGGASVEVKYLEPFGGRTNAGVATGYGRGLYGRGLYGMPRPDTGTAEPASSWSLDTWGQNLVGCIDSGGELYEWALNTSTPAAIIANAPTGCSGLLVSPEKFLIAFKGRSVEWSDQEDNTVWTPSATNQAGDFVLPTAGNIQCGLRLAQGFLILTDADAWQATYLDPTYVYGFRRVGEGCGAISRKCAVSTDTQSAWMGDSAFYVYQGGYAEAVRCEVADYVFANLNTGQKSKCFAQHRAEYGEVWWHYPSISATEVDSYVIWNYREGTWALGTMDRTATCDVAARLPYPLGVSSTGYVYEHEVGQNYDGSQTWSAETGPLTLGAGDYMMEVQRIVPDEKTAGDATLYLYTRHYPNGAETEHGPYSAASPINLLVQAAQIRFRYEGARAADARIGGYRAEVRRGDPIFP